MFADRTSATSRGISGSYSGAGRVQNSASVQKLVSANLHCLELHFRFAATIVQPDHLFNAAIAFAVRIEIAGTDAVITHANEFLRAAIGKANALHAGDELGVHAMVAQADVFIGSEICEAGGAHAANVFFVNPVIAQAAELVRAEVAEAGLLHLGG